MNKNADAFRTISEVAGELDLPQHVSALLGDPFSSNQAFKARRWWALLPARDIEVFRAIKHLLYKEGYTIRGVQRVLKEQGSGALAAFEDAGNITCLEMSDGMEYDLTAHDQVPSPEDDGTVRSGSRELAETSGVVADRAEAAYEGRKDMGGSSGLTGEDIERLRAALTELAECASILDAAQRQ